MVGRLKSSNSTRNADILIAGAGIIGLSLALELHARGAHVTVLERDTALSHASTAAAGMLAAQDPHNPPALLPLSHLSISLYPAFLQRVEFLTGLAIPYQTDTTIQYLSNGSSLRLTEHSLDPRQLAAALLAAVRATSIDLREHTIVQSCNEHLHVKTTTSEFRPARFISTVGAWAQPHTRPIKGQMLRVQLPAAFALQEVHRSEHIYIVPRTHGPQAGTALLGATVEDAGFNRTTHPADLNHLRQLAADLLPELSSADDAPQVEAWAGLRPGTADALPLLGTSTRNTKHFLATGHFRNGILLAPATAVVMADLLEGKEPAVDLNPFSPQRYATA
jgi:glycine oxidase